MKFLAFFMVCLTAVSGFVAPSAPRLSTSVRPATAAAPMRMGLKEDFQKVATTASAAVLTAAPAFATEGTGEVRVRLALAFEGLKKLVHGTDLTPLLLTRESAHMRQARRRIRASSCSVFLRVSGVEDGAFALEAC